MTPEQAIQRLQLVPYDKGSGTLDGADCFGIVELWFWLVLGIKITDRGEIAPGHAGLEEGVSRKVDWRPVEQPVDHCLVLMRAGRFEYGHIGVFWCGHVLHSDEATGCVFEHISAREIKPRITGYLVRK